MIKAAGILFVSDGKALLLKRSNEGDHPREWALAGGKLEEGETPEQAALREFQEECGHTYEGKLLPIMHTNDGRVEYDTFLAVVSEQFQPKLNDEHTAYLWCDLDDYPNKTHPAVKSLFDSDVVNNIPLDSIADCTVARADSVDVVTETDIANKIKNKELTSPQRFANVWLFAIRITGTGVAYRPVLDEFAHRDPANYLNDEFLARCNGLPVIWVHPPEAKLDSNSFAERVIGTVCLPYIAGDEVWGVAKIFDDDAAQMMQDEQLSTSPNVTFKAGTNKIAQMADGTDVLMEGKPNLIDHIAIVQNGVWDKGGEPSGVLVEPAHVEMTDASRSDSASYSDSPATKEGEVKMAEEIAASAPAAAPENEVLAILKSLAPKIEDLVTRVAALEEVEKAEVAAMSDGLPAPALPVDHVAAAPAADAAPVVAPVSPSVDKARMDALEAEIAKLRGEIPKEVPEEEKANLTEAQSKADRADAARGDSAPRPLSGDTAISYTHRQLARHISHSPRWKDKADAVAKISDASLLGTIADEVYADSIVASRSCVGLADNQVVPIKTMDGGCETTKFLGKKSFVVGMTQRAM